MKTFAYFFTLLSISLGLIACASNQKEINEGQTVSEIHKIESKFNKIDASSGLSVTYIQGSPQSLLIEGDSKDIEKYEFFTKNSTLYLQRKKLKFGNQKKTVRMTVTAPDVTEFEIGTGCTLHLAELSSNNKIDIDLATGCSLSAGNISATEVEIDLSTGSTGTINNLNTEKLMIDAATGSTINIKGKGEKIEIVASTGSSVNASEYRAKYASIVGSTGSNVHYYAEETSETASTGSSLKNYCK